MSRLDGIDARFEEVSLLITDPSVISDMKRFVKLTKEYKDLEKLTKVTSKYKQMLRDIEEAREVLDTETDPDMRELQKKTLTPTPPPFRKSRRKSNCCLSLRIQKTTKT